MKKLSFASDYQEGAHPTIMQRLCETNLLQCAGYGADEFCESARAKIRNSCRCPNAAVYFLVGGTQANAVIISASLQSYQGVIAAKSGHISTHEAGAIEYGRHKVLALSHTLGKLSANQIREYCADYRNDPNHEHMVMPGMVYLSQPTEYGTLYSLSEISAIRDVCAEYGLLLYIDGARLAYALACEKNDVALHDLARLCDVFYIGGTKCGALFGEAVVVPNPNLLRHFFTVMKQHGALLAKGRLLGIQFDTLFTDDLYKKAGKTAIQTAGEMKSIFAAKGYRFAFDSPTNQIFIIVENSAMRRLSEFVDFSFWEKYDSSHSVIRFASSWATRMEDVRQLSEVL